MSRPPIVHQFTAVLAGRDAVGHHTLVVDEILRDLGCETAIFAAHVNNEVKSQGRDFRDHPSAPTPDLMIYQASTGTPVADYLLTRNEPLVLNYHNITPAEMFDPWEPHVGAELDHGRRQIARLARRAVRGIAVSDYNASELTALGLEDVVVAPVLWELPEGLEGARDERLDGVSAYECSVGRELAASETATVLFVGRVAPNKCHEDLISAFAVLRGWWPELRLVLVGGVSSGSYLAALEGLVDRLGLGDSVVFAGSLSAQELAGWYSGADVFLCLSEHEGFCVPLVEAMAWGVPVVAFGAAAVPETVGDAGVVLGVKDPVAVAVAVDRVLSDDGLREVLIGRGRERAARFDVSVAREAMRQALQHVLHSVEASL